MRTAVLEAVDPDAPARRAAAGTAAGREILADQLATERDAVATLLNRLQQLKRELAGILAGAGASDFRRFSVSSLAADVDTLIADATRDLAKLVGPTLSRAFDLGTASVDAPVQAARIALSRAPQLDRTLVTHAYDTSVELLTEPMQQFGNQVKQGIRRAALAGASTFDELRSLSVSIDTAGFDAAAFKAERIVRTEFGRVLNGSTYDRLVALVSDLPFLRKGWRATKDGRTRLGHVEAGNNYARGKGIPILEPFRVNVYQEFPGKPPKKIGVASLRYPIDPETTPAGRVAAATTILCRCNGFVDFDLAELSAFSTSRSGGVVVPPPAVPRGGFAEPPLPGPAPIVPPARELTAAETRAQLETLGKRRKATLAQLADDYSTADDAYVGGMRTANTMANQTLDNPEYVRALEEIDRLAGEASKASIALTKARERYEMLARDLVAVPEASRATITRDFVSEEFYSGWSEVRQKDGTYTRTYTGQAKAKAEILAAFDDVEKLVSKNLSFGPKVFIDRAKDARGKFQSRAYAVDTTMSGAYRIGNSVAFNASPDGHTIAHELGHVLEFNNPSVREAAINFLERRTRGEVAKSLNTLTGSTAYEVWEYGRKDKFLDPYMGKDYGAARWTEIVSMGLELFYYDPVRFAREDPEYFDLMFELLRGR